VHGETSSQPGVRRREPTQHSPAAVSLPSWPPPSLAAATAELAVAAEQSDAACVTIRPTLSGPERMGAQVQHRP
jgi:hypothetical protein